MKKIIICVFFLTTATTSFSQQSKRSQEDYLKKSENQKTAAWVLLGGGTLLMGTGFLIGNGNEASFSDAAGGVVIAGIGLLSAIGSIPLFIASSGNKRKAAKVSASLKIERLLFVRQTAFTKSQYPAVSVKINL